MATQNAGGDPLALADVPFASPRYIDRLRALSALLQTLRAADASVPLGDQLARLLDFYRPAFERLYPDDYAQREPDLDALLALAETYPSRPALLEGLALDPLDLTANEAEGADEDEPPLVLSTVHSAKGLEFDTVFLIQAVDGVFPSQYAAKVGGGAGRGAAPALRGAHARRARALRLLPAHAARPRRRFFHRADALSRRHARDAAGAVVARRRGAACAARGAEAVAATRVIR